MERENQYIVSTGTRKNQTRMYTGITADRQLYAILDMWRGMENDVMLGGTRGKRREQEQYLLLRTLPLNCGVAVADTILLQRILSWTSSSAVPTALISGLTQSIHLCFGLSLFLLPQGTMSSISLPSYSWSRLFTCPNHLSIAYLHLSL